MSRRQRIAADQEERLSQAQTASCEINARGERVEDQISLVRRLTEGWRRVHEHNHLAELFQGKGST